MRNFISVAVCLLILLVLARIDVTAQSKNDKTKQRAQRPTFKEAETSRYFFRDVFTKLNGSRPTNPSATPAPTAAANNNSSGSHAGSGAGYSWSKIISATTIEDEIKSLKLKVDKNVTTPSDFAGRGHKQVRRDFSVLAMLFAIVGEYDGDVRWKKDAAAAREVFARTASNTKAGGNSNTYKESKQRKDDLQDLLSGSSLQTTAEEETADWEKICDRGPLMKRLELGFEGDLSGWLSNENAFKDNSDGVRHEAEMVAAIGEVLTKEGMEDGDDEEYAAFATRMKAAALEIVSGVKLNNYEQVRQAAGNVKKACSECHESYR